MVYRQVNGGLHSCYVQNLYMLCSSLLYRRHSISVKPRFLMDTFACTCLKRLLIATLVLTFAMGAAIGQSRTHIDSLFDHGMRNDSSVLVGEEIITKSRRISYPLGIAKGELVKGVGFLDRNALDSAALLLIQAMNGSADWEKTHSYMHYPLIF